MRTPCTDCPFRRRSMQGWVGNASPEEFMSTVMGDVPMPCHKTLDYDNPAWRERWETREQGEECAGASVFFANICKRSRDRTRQILPRDKKLVFSSVQEFLEHHNTGTFKSWKDESEQIVKE